MIFKNLVRTLFSILAITLLWLQAAQAQEFVWAPELATGKTLPPISALDQTGTVRTLAEITGEKGLVLVLSRSFDWCPYCISQLQQLVSAEEQFNAMSINVATMTYDPVATLAEAAEEHGITFPLLFDEDVRHVNAMGIRNLQYEPGHRAYGIPYPGIFLLDANGVIRAKFAEEDYRLRPDFSLVLEAATKL
ncbi:MAG: redoxin domain-containing protein [Gammaproteobacteria bacterium]|nr:redoxin domain-containing protein [Gammaproteobacteria bacterium]MDP2141399.1 redoxin domain-containing protein [Gammaproteobacteria bacterium]MDP2346447.1 redoxin domain-containing protein [Gammaproteobacteria bacterium]